MIRCLAIDDEPLALKQLVAYIHKVPYLELAAQCQSALEARSFLENDTVDAIFCDINMPDLNGMDFVKSLVAPPLIVFTTAYSEYAVTKMIFVCGEICLRRTANSRPLIPGISISQNT